MTIKGQDWSAYQSSTPNLAGADFAFIKATEGTSYVNPKMNVQAAHARRAGLVLGFYHFVNGSSSMAAQAKYFVEKCDSVEHDILWLDWENSSVSCAEKDQFLHEVKRLRGFSHRVGLYCNLDYWRHRDTTSNAGDALWIAQYGVGAGNPGIDYAWKFHQYTDNPVDTSVGRFASRAALAAWAGYEVDDDADVPLPTVSLSKLIQAAKTDPKAAQGHQTYSSGTKLAERALVKLGFLKDTKLSKDGSFGSVTVEAWADFQRWYSEKHHLGWTGNDVNGIPGKTSLKAVGELSGLFEGGK